MKQLLHILCTLLLLTSCASDESKSFDKSLFDKLLYKPSYASGFEIWGCDESDATLIVVTDPWQGAEGVEQMLLIDPEGEYKSVDANIQRIAGEAKRVVCMSSSYVAMLSAIGQQERIAGVSGINFISDRYVIANRDRIGDVGYDNNINYELLVALDADLVLLYGVMAASGMESKLRELGIPYIYFGEYVESSPLGKAEWMVAAGEVVGDRQSAEQQFSEVAKRYNNLKESIKPSSTKPKIMLNTPYRDSWFIPSAQSYMVRLINDAGAECFTTPGEGNSSQPVDIEQAYLWASEADGWLNVGSCNSMAELTSQNPRFADVKAVRNGLVFNNNARQTEMGGSDFWESGVVCPDVILQDLIKITKICSDQSDASNELQYYKQLR